MICLFLKDISLSFVGANKTTIFNFKFLIMKTVIRIEYPLDGIGMFMTYLSDKETEREIKPLDKFCISAYRRHCEFNCPFQDGLNKYKDSKEWFCSYKSIEQLQQWIKTNELKRIIKEGYVVLMLDVTEYQEGRDQIIYTKESIKSSKDITSLFK